MVERPGPSPARGMVEKHDHRTFEVIFQLGQLVHGRLRLIGMLLQLPSQFVRDGQRTLLGAHREYVAEISLNLRPL